MDRAPEQTVANTTLIQLATPADGASFADRWSEGAVTVEAKPDGQGIGQLGEAKA